MLKKKGGKGAQGGRASNSEINGIVKKKILKRGGKGPTTGKNNPLERVFLFFVFQKKHKN